MSNENMNNQFHPIEEPVPIDPDSAKDILSWVGSAIVIAGSVVLFSSMVLPARARGATMSSKLRWQARQAQAQESIAQAQAAEAQAAADTKAPEPASAPAPVPVPPTHAPAKSIP